MTGRRSLATDLDDECRNESQGDLEHHHEEGDKSRVITAENWLEDSSGEVHD